VGERAGAATAESDLSAAPHWDFFNHGARWERRIVSVKTL